MPWPYLFFVFVTLVLAKSAHGFAATVAVVACGIFFYLDWRRGARAYLPAIFCGIILGGALFILRAPLIETQVKAPLAGEAEVTGVSRKSIVITITTGQKLRLTNLKTEQIPPKHARVRYRCTAQEIRASTFMVFERLSGVAAWCRTQELQVLSEPAGTLARYRERAFAFLNARFAKMECQGDTCTDDAHSLVAAFLLGDTDDLTPTELVAFRDMGLMHLFAVSGLNIALLFAILYLPFRALGQPAIGAALGYTIATAFLLLLDFPVPLLRAWLFMTIALALRLADRRLPPWTLLFLTAIVVELLFPLSTFTMSFILSFGVTAAILVFYEPLYFCFASPKRLLNLAAEHTALSLAAGLPALILGFLLFGNAQPLSLLYNLLLVPFSGLYLFVALVFLIFESAKYFLIALDTLYLKFAALHTHYVARYFPAADKTAQWISLTLLALAFAYIYYLKKRHQLWSVRRNLRFIISITAIVLVSPYFLTQYPQRAFYIVPNKVWMYNGNEITTQGNAIFSQDSEQSPQYCFPVHREQVIVTQITPPEIINLSGACFIFTGRMRPETWPQNILTNCRELNVLQAKSAQTDAAEWKKLFVLFGYSGSVVIRRFFTWYSDCPLLCARSEKI
ncbi:MAG: ComEC/Rec2 family competence protein [Spirochaetes bacterium]|nr:ComEC/Rec2 family competence protein [Spirochaetota bacterium]